MTETSLFLTAVGQNVTNLDSIWPTLVASPTQTQGRSAARKQL
jgi:hypothetical protein